MQTKEQLETYIAGRRQEVAGYQVNIDNYTAMLKLIPHDLEPRLAQYANTKIEELYGTLPEADLQAISDVQFYKRIAGTLVIEKLEQRKAQFVLDAMVMQLA